MPLASVVNVAILCLSHTEKEYVYLPVFFMFLFVSKVFYLQSNRDCTLTFDIQASRLSLSRVCRYLGCGPHLCVCPVTTEFLPPHSMVVVEQSLQGGP